MTAPIYPDLAMEPLRWWDLPAVAALEEDLFVGDSPWTEAMFWSELAQGHTYLAVWDGTSWSGTPGSPCTTTPPTCRPSGCSAATRAPGSAAG